MVEMEPTSDDRRFLTYPQLAVLLLAIGSVAAMIYAVRPQLPSIWTFPFDMPATAYLINSHHHQAGFDSSQGYCFRVEDDQLRDLLIKHWKLDRINDPRDPSISFVETDPPPWWPPEGQLAKLPEQYEREALEGGERYWSVWIDRDHNLLWAERGKW